MSEIGIDPSNTSKRLGHASSQMTLDVYTHTTKTGEKTLLTNLQIISIKQNRIVMFKILEEVIRRLSQSYSELKSRLKSTLQNLCKVL